MKGSSIHDSSAQTVTNITISMNVPTNDIVYETINSNFIGADIARTANIKNVSGVNDGTNWTSLTIGADTYGIGGGSAPTNMVTTDTAQTITGVKTFNSNTNFSGMYVKFLNDGVAGYTLLSAEPNQGLTTATISTNNGVAISMAGYSGTNGGVIISAIKSGSNYPSLRPNRNDTIDLGNSTYKWKNLYLSGNLSDGTNTVTIANLAALITYAKGQGWIK